MKNACMTIKRQRPNSMQNIVHTDIKAFNRWIT